MTRDRLRDREALGAVIVSRYCSECGRTIPIEDERSFERDKAAHMGRHLRERRG